MSPRPTTVLAAGLLLLATGAAAEQIVPTPRATKLPATAVNRPFLEARSAREPVALASRGYAEEEYLVSGLANIYDWAEPGATPAVRVRTPNVPYTTRILVRRPTDAARFSGRVVVELLNPTAGYDQALLWGLSGEHFLRTGDVWVGVTVKPVAAASLQVFDAVRYAQVSFAFTQPPECVPAAPAPGRVDGDSAKAENGLAWDIVAQVGALLRSQSKENPLVAYDVRRVVAAGYSQTGSYIVTYANALHAEDRLGDGRPVFDAYVNAAGASVVPINQCAPPLPDGDPRRAVLPRDVPFVTVMTQTEFDRALFRRRPDGDEPGDVSRYYEVAGASHAAPSSAGQPNDADLRIAGFERDAAVPCIEARSDFPLGLALNAVWQQIDDQLTLGTPMVRASVLETVGGGAVATDATGNALGGLRQPAVDVPVAVYGGRSTPKDPGDARAVFACGLTGSKRPLDSAELKGLYGSRAEYLKRYNASVDAAVQERRLLPADAALLKAQAARLAPAF